MAYKMKGFGGFKSPTKFKMNGQDNLRGHSTKKRAKLARANKILRKIGMEEIKKPFSKGLDMTLNENLNKAVRKSEAKEFLRKNTIQPKAKKPLSRPFGPGTRPLARNVSKALRTIGKRAGAVGVAYGLYEGVKEVFKGYGKMGKTKQGKEIIKRGRMQPGKI